MRYVHFIVCIFCCLSVSKALAQNISTNYDGNWASRYVRLSHTLEAEWMIRVGDIDNLGLGFDKNYNPFSGDTSAQHIYPSVLLPNEPDGLDIIQIPSSFKKTNQPCIADEYSSHYGFMMNYYRKTIFPIPISLGLPEDMPIQAVTMMFFIDDIQCAKSCSRFKVYLNNTRATFIEDSLKKINLVQQGKLVTVSIPQSHLGLFKEKKLTLLIDDDTSGAGDGFAIDFVKILINPRKNNGELNGTLTEVNTGNPIHGALVRSENGTQAVSNHGKFTLKNLTLGTQVITVSAQNYNTKNFTVDVSETPSVVKFELYKLAIHSNEFPDLKNPKLSDKIILHHTHFAPDMIYLKRESHEELNKLVRFLENNPDIHIRINGHTDNGTNINAQHLQYLSENRAKSVVEYLVNKGIDAQRLSFKGFGGTQPIADNKTPEGRAKNRRVEFEIIKL